ncbi:mitochondrial import inner membrane translocase subunit Tim9-like [Gigantopelta aegis]|uniref:mitochondrial import inner membrane translocase subunit Tim9-like n=1 Tax=Gigantopelta aegis TaxID=1735272 RepID=UPI001B8888AC|nr:mitochondrial import inner membrane translocase subunit Tim9-like [Gigantopelta aegis]XP_041354125.1 mitochondrial import inner membrane translocase subunit Tim9-like [Gigantopelta aegis]XP_041354126.1 mitochondrial import inner membrane translocase subunit Tim9-like [Gigantopelta aegis]
MASTSVPQPFQLDPESTVKQFQEFLASYNRVSEMCFTDCVHDFTTRKILESENTCALNCLEKYLKMTQRISQRFQEYQMMQSDPTAAVQNLASQK